jgi:hypothetical protein
MDAPLAERLPPITVVNSVGIRSSFVPERFAAGILRTIAPEHVKNVLNAADVLHGVLMGFHARDLSGPTTISTDQLRAAQAVILANPTRPDLPTLARIITRNEPFLRTGVADGLGIQKFYEAIAAAASVAIVPEARFSLVSLVEQFSNGSLLVQQRLVKLIASSGTMTDVAAGAVNESHMLGRALAFEQVTVTGLLLDSVAKARAIFASTHTLFTSAPTAGGGLVTRAFYLSNVPDMGALRAGTLIYMPSWTGFAITPEIVLVAVMRAATGDIELLKVFPTAMLITVQTSNLLAASWRGAFRVVAKLIEIVPLGFAMGGETIGGLVTSPTVVGPLAAAALIILTLLAMIKLFIDLILQLVDETEQDKLRRLLDRLKELVEKAQKIDTKSDPNAKDELKGILNEAHTTVDEAKTLAGESVTEDAVHALDGLLNTADAALK